MSDNYLKDLFISEAKVSLTAPTRYGGGSEPANIQPLEVTENGVYEIEGDVDGYGPVTVNVEPPASDDSALLVALLDGSATEIDVDNIELIGEYSCYQRPALTQVNLPNVETIGKYAFSGCSKLAEVNLPKCTTLTERCFRATKLKHIYLPSLLSIGAHSFEQCSVLEDADFPVCTNVGGFSNCTKLTTVNCPEAVTVLSLGFSTCTSLTKLDLPKATVIEAAAFRSSSNLEYIILRTQEQACVMNNSNVLESTPFASGKAGGKLLVPAALVEEYKVATNWAAIWGYGHNKFLALEDYTVDGTITGEIDWDKLNAV